MMQSCKHRTQLWPNTELVVCLTSNLFIILSSEAGTENLPVSIFPSWAAGPSGITLFTCRNSSGSSPPMMVNPKPMLLFCKAVDRKLPFSWVGSLVNSGFSADFREDAS